jgi:hypothetical protein
VLPARITVEREIELVPIRSAHPQPVVGRRVAGLQRRQLLVQHQRHEVRLRQPGRRSRVESRIRAQQREGTVQREALAGGNLHDVEAFGTQALDGIAVEAVDLHGGRGCDGDGRYAAQRSCRLLSGRTQRDPDQWVRPHPLGGPGITKSDLLVINKTALAPHVGAPLSIMERDAQRMRGERPFVFANVKTRDGLTAIIEILSREAMLALAPPASE